MHIYYHISHYISHRRCGLAYIACLREAGHTVYTSAADAHRADVAILHDDPLQLPLLFAALPLLHEKQTIAYAVWENETFPPSYIHPLRLVKNIWTCSEFVRQSMSPHFTSVQVVPHIVERVPVSMEAHQWAKQRIQAASGRFTFLCVSDAVNPRKNIKALMSAFHSLQKRLPLPVQLVIKQHRGFMDFSFEPHVLCINEEISDEQMAALHCACDAYVSPHHAEGWGLGLSEAMSFGKPVIATGYSGNMEYMDASNSFPIPYTLEPVSEEMSGKIPLFTREMRWAEIHQEDLVAAMRQVAQRRIPPSLPGNAARITTRFGRQAVLRILETHLAELFPQGQRPD